MSDRRKITSPENGRLSKGPITQAGKDRSARNSLRHGFLAKYTVLPGESEEGFHDTISSFYARFQPRDEVEESLVDDMASSYWRIYRLWSIESVMMTKQIGAQPPGEPLVRIAGAFGNLADSNQYNLLQRYDARLHRSFQRALHSLADLKKLSPHVGQPSGCPDPPAQETNGEPTQAGSNPPTRFSPGGESPREDPDAGPTNQEPSSPPSQPQPEEPDTEETDRNPNSGWDPAIRLREAKNLTAKQTNFMTALFPFLFVLIRIFSWLSSHLRITGPGLVAAKPAAAGDVAWWTRSQFSILKYLQERQQLPVLDIPNPGSHPCASSPN